MSEEVKIIHKDTKLKTSGLTAFGNAELHIDASMPELVDEGVEYLTTLVHQISTSDFRVNDGDSMVAGYWPYLFTKYKVTYLEAFEVTKGFDNVQPGLATALTYRQEQREACACFHAAYDPVTAYEHAVISAGVQEGLPTHGSRYAGGDGRSGWYLYTDLYNGDISTMTWHHLYHLTDAQPRLAKFLALPLGYRFFISDEKENAYFDQEIFDQESENAAE